MAVSRLVKVSAQGHRARHAEGVAAGAVDDDGGDGGDAGPERDAGDGRLVGELAGPAGEVVGEHRAGEPGGVGVVVP